MNDLDLKTLWKEQPMTPATITLDDIKTSAAKFERTTKWRNIREWAAVLFVVPVFSWLAISTSSLLTRAGALCIVAAAIFIAFVLWRYGRTKVVADAKLDTRAFAHAHAEELRDQAKLLRRVPLWYLSPLAVGLLLMHAGSYPAPGQPLGFWLGYLGLVIALYAGIGILNLRAAKKLGDKADALEP